MKKVGNIILLQMNIMKVKLIQVKLIRRIIYAKNITKDITHIVKNVI